MKDGKIIYLSGKVLVNDYSKDTENFVELKEYEYQDNIIEILAQENIIEELENRKKELNNRINKNYEAIKDNKNAQKTAIALWIGVPIFCAILGTVLSPGLTSVSLFGIKQAWLSMATFGFMVTTFVNGFSFIALKQNLKILKSWKKGYEFESMQLEKELENSKEILKQLRNNKSRENEQQAMTKKTDDIHNIHLDKYRKIRRNLLVWREIGENEKELIQYYNNNMLDEKLADSYEKEEIEAVKTYFKNKK